MKLHRFGEDFLDWGRTWTKCDAKQHNACSQLLPNYWSKGIHLLERGERWRQRDGQGIRHWWHVRKHRYNRKWLNDFWKGNKSKFAFWICLPRVWIGQPSTIPVSKLNRCFSKMWRHIESYSLSVKKKKKTKKQKQSLWNFF